MFAPLVLCLRGRLGEPGAAFAHVVEVADHPLDVLLDRHDDVRQHRGTAGSGDDEQVGEPGHRDAEVGSRTVLPGLAQAGALPAADVDLTQGAGQGVESGREDQRVEFVDAGLGADALRNDLHDRVGP